MAYRDSRVKSMAQYIIVDEIPQSSFQSGLRDRNGVPTILRRVALCGVGAVRAAPGVRV